MKITHNIQAMNVQRTLNGNVKRRKKTIEKLSSGYKINRSADDAAGLSISEKMRNQIRGLNQATKNSEDGISLIQTAEGALDEVSSILKRMRELSVQGANDINAVEDRNSIQNEIEELKTEIDRISETTAFNNRKLLNGELGDSSTKIVQEARVTLSVQGDSYTKKFIFDENGKRYKNDLQGTKELAEYLSNNPEAKLYKGSKNPSTEYQEPGDDWVWLKVGVSPIDSSKWKEDDLVFKMTNMSKNKYLRYENVSTGQIYTPDELANYLGVHVLGDSQMDQEDPVGLFENTLYKVMPTRKLNAVATEGVDYVFEQAKEEEIGGKPLYLQVGANAGENMKITINAINTAILGVGDVSVANHEDASDSLDMLDEANRIVSGLRSELGAKQNRLEFTINNLTNYSENLQKAESEIRDTDMAETVMQDSKDSILIQVAQSMLAQANQSEQSVLDLLRL